MVTDAEWRTAAVEYIALLSAELARSAVYLDAHGWTVDETVVRRGEELRAILGIGGEDEH